MNYTPKQLKEMYNQLPEDVQEALYSVDTTETLQKIGKEYGLHVDQVGDLADETGKVMVGVVHPRDFRSVVQKRLKLDDEAARKVVQEVNERLFQPIRQSLREVHGEAARPVRTEKSEKGEAPEKTQEGTPAQPRIVSESKKPDTYREPIGEEDLTLPQTSPAPAGETPRDPAKEIWRATTEDAPKTRTVPEMQPSQPAQEEQAEAKPSFAQAAASDESTASQAGEARKKGEKKSFLKNLAAETGKHEDQEQNTPTAPTPSEEKPKDQVEEPARPEGGTARPASAQAAASDESTASQASEAEKEESEPRPQSPLKQAQEILEEEIPPSREELLREIEKAGAEPAEPEAQVEPEQKEKADKAKQPKANTLQDDSDDPYREPVK